MTSRRIGGRSIELSNQDKILFPGDDITKGDIVAYYDAIAPRILPFLEGRPLVVERFPDGIAAGGFFQKQASPHTPEWVRTLRVRKQGGFQSLVVCDDRATLVWLANQAAIVLHPWLSRAESIDRPDVFIVDLDPPSGAFAQARNVALSLKRLFDELDVPVFLKTTGSKGLHLLVPLRGTEDFDTVRGVGHSLMQVLASRHPDLVTTEVRKEKRKGRVYLDIARNAYAQTAVAPYSVRALECAPVSTPIAWQELRSPRIDARRWTIETAAAHATKDPWAGWRRRRCSMSAIAKKLAAC
ncbi:MAG TPA: non-homologous end-joining DNA ligase [Candidatus Binatia bacterium]|jgi:bifunctional non-homologous end joining protein LigD